MHLLNCAESRVLGPQKLLQEGAERSQIAEQLLAVAMYGGCFNGGLGILLMVL